jgi:hypothetical protein
MVGRKWRNFFVPAFVGVAAIEQDKIRDSKQVLN